MTITNPAIITLLIIVGLVLGVFLGVVMNRARHSKKLQERFGPEYHHAVDELGDKHQAERALEARLDHVKQLDIRPLTEKEMDRFTNEWRVTQAEFVDEPMKAMQKADHLIGEVMKARGYPIDDFEQRAADISVGYPEMVTDYRGLHSLAVKGKSQKVSTEELRKAMVHGRALFENLVRKDIDLEKERMS
jgi:hypothetical protein